MREKLLISSCLVGENVKYNGKNNLIDLTILRDKYELVPFCPEVAGGLSTPRLPSEIVSYSPLKLINRDGIDVTNEFVLGAKKTQNLVKQEGIKKALLKANSPSCSSSLVYNGSFNGELTKGVGVTTLFLEEIGVDVLDENSKFWL